MVEADVGDHSERTTCIDANLTLDFRSKKMNNNNSVVS